MIKFGSIGTNFIVDEFVQTIKTIKEIDYAVCYSRKEETANEFLKKNNLTTVQIITNLNDFVGKVDFVYVASPNGLHFEQSKFLLENKINVIVEKPLTFTVAQALELKKLANENNVFLFEAFKTKFVPNFFQIKKILESEIPNKVHFSMNQYSSRMNDTQKGIFNSVFDAELGKGSTYDMLIYPVELAIALFGKVKKIDYIYNQRLANGVAISNIVVLIHESGLVTTIDCSKNSHDIAPSQIFFDKKTLVFDRLTRIENLTLHNYILRMGPIKFPDSEINSHMYYEFVEFLKIFNEKNVIEMNRILDEAIDAIQILETVENQK
ncbi:Gfo/Idh/MocA family protein [Mesoplasma photuris]|uniref:Gfo/Idh/MocA family protein n=1 Tax=Mesoplasma photuris TaxID=217731 RepID=UPI0004E21D3B|nr:Gfo/Idh/MocA family oxidoreductase [Mesoplasma photuris]